MTGHHQRIRLAVATLAVLTGCGPEPALEVSRLSMIDEADQEGVQGETSGQEDADEVDVNGAPVLAGAPVLTGCELGTASTTGAPLPQGCSNNGTLLASSLAWVSLDSITMPDGSVASSVSLQGTRFVGTVNGVEVSGEAFVGARFNGTATNGSAVQVRLDGAVPGSLRQPDVWRYEFSYLNPKGDWKHLCKSNKRTVVVSGRWSYHQGDPGDGAKTNDPTVFTIGCRRSAIAKCIDAGYKPWVEVGDLSLDQFHQACVRMMRADYCGNGISHTRPGRKLVLYDVLGIQVDDRNWVREAAWTTGGARCLNAANLTQEQAPCGIPVTKECGEVSSSDADTLLISEIPKRGARDGHWH